MAKTFKNTQEHKPSEIPNSKKDILDFFDEEGAKPNVSVTKVTSIITPPSVELKHAPEEISDETRQTFIIGNTHLEKLKDYVYTERRKGNFEYNQRNAIEDAIDKLLEGKEIMQRPSELKAKEDNRKQKIIKGIKVKA